MEHDILVKGAVLLATAAIAAPLAKHLRIGGVLGYLFAGILIGPYVLGVFTEVESILHVAEFGIVLLLFVIGLELRTQRLWAMRKSVFGTGTAQVVLTSAALFAILYYYGLHPLKAAFLGLALSLSSTAFVIQVLQEKGELSKSHGRTAFSVLLFQDLAAIPMIAFVGLFAIAGDSSTPMTLAGIANAVLAIALVVIVGRYLVNRLYRMVAATGVKEAMTASALLTVVAVALLMDMAGLSAALGAFIAGALLAESEYRHEIEANIAPFEGLLLGLFFVAVGMSLNLSLLFEETAFILAATAVLMMAKAVVLYVLGRLQGLDNRAGRRFAVALCQAGEFAFVLAAAGLQVGAILQAEAEYVTVVVTLSMMLTPILLLADDWLTRSDEEDDGAHDDMPEDRGHVIIAGFGRFGQIVARILAARKIPFTALEKSASQVDFVRDFGNDVYYGNPARLDVLSAANAAEARAIVIAVDDAKEAEKIAKVVRNHYPELPILARARDRRHVHALMDIGVDKIERDTFHSALELGRKLLRTLDFDVATARETVQIFANHDEQRLIDDFQHYSDTRKVRESARRQAKELQELFEADSRDAESRDAAE